MASVAVEPLVYNVPQAAQALQVHPMTIRNLVKRGELPAVRIGDRVMISRSALVEFVGSRS
jgi:excisionase family DNA binding protein